MTSKKLKMENYLNMFKIEDEIKILKMEDDIKKFVNGRRPQKI